jgi:hypothetical protein
MVSANKTKSPGELAAEKLEKEALRKRRWVFVEILGWGCVPVVLAIWLVIRVAG